MFESFFLRKSIIYFCVTFIIFFLLLLFCLYFLCNYSTWLSVCYGFIVATAPSLFFLIVLKDYGYFGFSLKNFYFSTFVKICTSCVLLIIFFKIGIYSPLYFLISLFIVQISFWIGFLILMRV